MKYDYIFYATRFILVQLDYKLRVDFGSKFLKFVNFAHEYGYILIYNVLNCKNSVIKLIILWRDLLFYTKNEFEGYIMPL